MLDLRGSTVGDFDFSTRCLQPDEKKYYGIFISHASADNEDYLYPLRDAMLKMNMYPLCDRDFLSGGDDFQSKIESNLDCYAAVVIITPSSLASNWVNYEMGILSSRGIPLFLWDPTGLLHLSRDERNEHDIFSYTHIRRFKSVYEKMEDLLVALDGASPYSDMFREETAFLDCKTFRQRMKMHIETVICQLESEIFDEYHAEFADCKFGVLIPNFGMFYPDHADGEHCYVRRSIPLENKLCPQSGSFCALSAPRVLSEENKECVLLNHLTYSGRLFRRGERDHNGEAFSCGCVRFHLPVHRLYGTEFKFIIDVPKTADYDLLTALLEGAGMNPSRSASLLGGRIYLSLPERRAQGLFRLNHQFQNNFLCPYAARSGRKGDAQ